MKKVAIIQRLLPHYRIPFFASLEQKLLEAGVQLDLIYGQGTPSEKKKGDEVEWSKGYKIKNKYLNIANRYLVYQPCFWRTRKHDLIIFEQASKNLINLMLVAFASKQQKLAIWGHGKNFQQQNNNSKSEAYKQKFNRKVDHFFAYNDLSKRVMVENGIPPELITSVINAIDTQKLKSELNEVSINEVQTFISQHQLNPGKTGLFCSSMYTEKLIPLLIESAKAIQAKDAKFKLILIGSGPDQVIAQEAAKANEHIIYLGKLYGKEKALAYKSADFMMNPGLVGLNILDSFVANLPMITTNYPYHSPEIDYLQNKKNGLMCDENLYVENILQLLKDPNMLEALKKGCKESCDLYTIDNMANNFSKGILACLNKN